MVSVTNEITLNTSKLVSSRSVLFVNASTVGTCLGSMFGVNKDYWHSRELCFILNVGSKLIKTPSVKLASLCFSNRFLVADACQIFDSNRSSSVFCFSHYLLRDNMIDVVVVSFLFSTNSFEMSFSRPTTTALKRTPMSSHSSSMSFDFFSTMDLSITIYGDIDDAHIYSESFCGINHIGFGYIYDYTEIIDSVLNNKVCLTSNSFQSRFMIITENDWDLLSTINCKDANSVDSLPTEHPLVISNTSIWSESRENLFVSFIDFTDFSDSSYCELGGETVSFSNIVVAELLNLNFISSPMFVSNATYVVTSFIEPNHSLFENNFLFFCGFEFNLQSKIHNNRYCSWILISSLEGWVKVKWCLVYMTKGTRRSQNNAQR